MKLMFLCVVLLFSYPALACKCGGVRGNVEKIVYARVMSTKYVEKSSVPESYVKVKYKTIRVFKGESNKKEVLRESLGTCSIGVRAGREYVFYILKDGSTSICDGSKEVLGWTDWGKDILEKARLDGKEIK
ncbi:hypothetical protein [Teredinibacter sp. KSP-S5-2]|uniref:hypothetical protein n=1 Tax=Teredinibacter sp. KSP-S5-2 TaxID=3034506 RepID=UPI002934E0D9|nr:hypothetical protein [Teredinibacter sp. KSP-S5-2]WNO10310.1 hypothetical protein P5V12_03900 [Teredinibacter sp. KSP-S5-2]